MTDNDIKNRLAQLISMADQAVFPRDPLRVLASARRPPSPNLQLFLWHDEKDPGKSFYHIHVAGLQEYLEKMQVLCPHTMLEPQALDRARAKGILQMTFDEIMLGMVIHEVRHRTQLFLQAPLLTKNHTDQVLRCKLWGQMQTLLQQNDPMYAFEFDARFFQYYAAHELRQGRLPLTPDSLKALLCMTPEEFLAKEKK